MVLNKKFVATIDMYRKVPSDLLEGSKRGNLVSLTAIIAIVILFTLETLAFIRTRLVTDLALDRSTTPHLPVYFNITLMDLKCEYAVIDTVSVLGTSQNVTQGVHKVSIDREGVKRRYEGRRRHQKDTQGVLMLDESVEESLEEIVEKKGGVHDAVSLTPESFKTALEENTFLFVDFFAMWCSHCRALMPTWEKLAEVMYLAAETQTKQKLNFDTADFTEEEFKDAVRVELPVQIAKIDCVTHSDFCAENAIRGYPTLRLYILGEWVSDYQADRTIVAMTSWLRLMEKEYQKVHGAFELAHSMAENRITSQNDSQHHHLIYRAREMTSPHNGGTRAEEDDEHKGCELSGFLHLDRAPGNFHVEARSVLLELDPTMTNLSHEVHQLSFGFDPYVEQKDVAAPEGFVDSLHVADGNVYVTEELHTAFHHHLKLIPADYTEKRTKRKKRGYQMLLQSHLTHYPTDSVPEAKFTYDLSPVMVTYRTESRQWYTYLTSLMAIIGGAFTVLGLLESTMEVLGRQKIYMMGTKQYRTQQIQIK